MQFKDAANVNVSGGVISAQWRAISVVGGGQHAFMGTTIGNQTWAPDGYLLRAAGGSLGRVIGCFFIPSAKGRATSPISLVSKAGPWTVSQSQFMGFSAPLVSMDGSVPKIELQRSREYGHTVDEMRNAVSHARRRC